MDQGQQTAVSASEPEHRALFWGLAIGLGLLQVWAHRHDVVSDGVSYIELAWAGIHSGWHGFLNGYWSPLYPFVLSLAFRAFHPTPIWESTVVHLVNFAIGLAGLGCFEIFLRELVRSRAAGEATADPHAQVPSKTVWLWGYLFFLYATQVWVPVGLVTPDLLVATFAFAATACLLRIAAGRDDWTSYAFLGATLGLGYLSKAAMFPLSFIFLASSALAASSPRRAFPRAVLASLIFLAISLPWLSALSATKGRLTFGDTGVNNYAWYVDGVDSLHWQGGPGIPLHPTRKLLSEPALYEFAAPVLGSYPPTYDPSYWNDGIRPYFRLVGQYWALYLGANFYDQMLWRTGVPVAVLFLLLLLMWQAGSWTSLLPRNWAIWLPSYAALGMYEVVHVAPRLVGGFILMLLMALLAAARIPRHGTRARRLTLLITLAPALYLAWAVVQNVAALRAPPGISNLRMARELQRMGVAPGDTVGLIGDGAGTYWAHLAGIRIIADVPHTADYWAASPARQAEVLSKFAALEATMAIAEMPPLPASHGASAVMETPPSGWLAAAGTRYFVHRLSATAQ